MPPETHDRVQKLKQSNEYSFLIFIYEIINCEETGPLTREKFLQSVKGKMKIQLKVLMGYYVHLGRRLTKKL